MRPAAVTSCDRCLRRALLVGFLAPRIADLLDRPRRRAPGLLRLSDDDLIAAAGGADPAAAHRFLESVTLDRERERIAAAGIASVCRHDPAYPRGLRDLDDPPAALFAGGRVDLLERLAAPSAVAIVGSRRPSPYGIEVARALGRGLGAAGVPVVSGLALGIDGAAHRGCLAGGGLAVAVMACGPESAYPRRHRSLHRRLVEAGLVVAELPPGSPAFRWAFPARNRIMAALAAMTVVVEAAQPSGSLITADFARDLGRVVAAVPGRITWRMAAGTNALLRDGAAPITSAQDVLDELFGAGARTAPSAGDPAREPVAPGCGSTAARPTAGPDLVGPVRDSTEAGAVRSRRPDSGPATGQPTAGTLDAVLAGVESGSGPDEIAAAAGLSAGEVRAALGALEADGLIVRSDLAGWQRRAT